MKRNGNYDLKDVISYCANDKNEINDEFIIKLFKNKDGKINSNNIRTLTRGLYPNKIVDYLYKRYLPDKCKDFHIIIFHIIRHLTELTKCKFCEKILPYSQLKYNRPYCSLKCSYSDKNRLVINKQKLKEKTGYENVSQIPLCKGKNTKHSTKALLC